MCLKVQVFSACPAAADFTRKKTKKSEKNQNPEKMKFTAALHY
jgi:GTP cyclohydrolase FolE2